MTGATRNATVHLLCGYNGAGKTTYAKRFAEETMAIRLSLDEWMIRLYPKIPYDADGYGPLAEACKELIWDLAQQSLRLGTDVVLDWNQWSRVRRATWREKAHDAGFSVLLHFIDVPVETAVQRAQDRATQHDPHSHSLKPGDVQNLARIFEKPSTGEHIPTRVIKG